MVVVIAQLLIGLPSASETAASKSWLPPLILFQDQSSTIVQWDVGGILNGDKISTQKRLGGQKPTPIWALSPACYP